MILVDTSVWVDHLRRNDETLAKLLDSGSILAHPFVMGELALGNMRGRETVLPALADPPQAETATDPEIQTFIDRDALFGHGIGYVNVHLRAAVRLTAGAKLWTADQRLHDASPLLNLAFGVFQDRD